MQSNHKYIFGKRMIDQKFSLTSLLTIVG